MLERAGAEVEREIDQRIKLLLRERHRYQIVYGLHGHLDILLKPLFRLLLGAGHAHDNAARVSVSDGGNPYAIKISRQAAAFKGFCELKSIRRVVHDRSLSSRNIH